LCAGAEDIHQPGAAPTATDPSGEGTWQSTAPDVQGALGRAVYSGTGEDLGRIIDVLVDKGGHVRAAVIDFGGFLGVGSRKVVVDWAALHFPPVDPGDRRI
jgi:hypothetical protein